MTAVKLTKTKKPVNDLVVINRVTKLFDQITEEERRRVLQYVAEKYINEPARKIQSAGALTPTGEKLRAANVG